MRRNSCRHEEVPMSMHVPSRRYLLRSALAASGVGVTGLPRIGIGQELAATPACKDGDAATLPEIEGPFFKPRSPERSDLTMPPARGRVTELSGYVLTRGCRPVSRALLDLWHADDSGEYDNRGFRYRGHIFTDADGRY